MLTSFATTGLAAGAGLATGVGFAAGVALAVATGAGFLGAGVAFTGAGASRCISHFEMAGANSFCERDPTNTPI